MKKSWIYGKTVIVTGASSGIGKALSLSLVRNHACKVIGIARNEERLRAMQELLGEAFCFEILDVGNKEAWLAFAQKLTKKNIQPDILINNAGMLPPFKRFEDTIEETFNRTIQTNFLSVVYACGTLLPILKQSSTPAILNVASSSALCCLPGITAYAASKAAVKNFTESLASEYNKKDLYVGLVLPGFTLTDIFREQSTKGQQDKLIKSVATPCEKMEKKIERALIKRKPRKVFGLDAKGMDILYKLFPSRAAALCGKVLKLFKVTLFEDVFKY